ncbi:MAG: PadR family transcriptional regulator, partial [Conexibacter sp.]|nr:PadR family transcriptional regulator [Conexibacter sp.]
MPLHHALLSLLQPRESYGYELKGAFERAVGPQWGPLNIGHVYQLLERLLRDDLVTEVGAVATDRRPDRRMYAITDAGRAELDDWLSRPAGLGTGYRDELHLKLVAAARVGEEALRAIVRRERETLLGELHALHELPSDDE